MNTMLKKSNKFSWSVVDIKKISENSYNNKKKENDNGKTDKHKLKK